MTQYLVQVANAERIAWEVIADTMAPPPPVDYVAWAEHNITFSERESQFRGNYNRDLFGYFDEVLRALSPDDPCRIVTLRKSAQIGGTVLANIFVGGSMDMDPGDILYVHPTENNAQRWSKMKLAPMLRSTTALAAVFPQKARDGLDSVLYKERIDGKGAILISGANSPASLSQVTMRRQVQDDLAKWEMNTAGDPETQADSRSRAHEFAKIFKVSTPLLEPGCRISRSFEAGSQERLFVPCPHCGHMQTLEWENFLVDEDAPERSHFVCADAECGGVIEQHHRAGMRRGGEWRADNPKAKRVHRSFDIWSAYSELQSFETIAREWLKSRGDPASEQTFFNDTLGRPYRTKGEAPPWEGLRDRAMKSDRPRGRIPAGFSVITCGVDCQADRVEWQVVAWGRDYRRAVVDAGVYPGHISSAEAQASLDALLKQPFINAYGRALHVDRLAIDGNAWTEDVWGWAKRHPSSRVIMVRGVGSETAPLLALVKKEVSRSGRKLPYSKRFYNFATSVLKMALYRNLMKADPLERGFVDLPRGLEDEYFRQLTAERRIGRKQRDGSVKYGWEKDAAQPNEMLDTHLQAEAAFIRMVGVTRTLPDAIWDRFDAERETPPPPDQGDIEDLFEHHPAPAPPAPTPVAIRARPRQTKIRLR